VKRGAGWTLRLATYLAPSMWPVYEFIAAFVGDALDRPATLVTGSSFDQFAEGEVDVGFI
jgi:hypothetical protein